MSAMSALVISKMKPQFKSLIVKCKGKNFKREKENLDLFIKNIVVEGYHCESRIKYSGKNSSSVNMERLKDGKAELFRLFTVINRFLNNQRK